LNHTRVCRSRIIKRVLLLLLVLSLLGALPASARALDDGDAVIVYVVPKDADGKHLAVFRYEATAGEWKAYKKGPLQARLEKEYDTDKFGRSYIVEGKCGVMYSHVDNDDKIYALSPYHKTLEAAKKYARDKVKYDDSAVVHEIRCPGAAADASSSQAQAGEKAGGATIVEVECESPKIGLNPARVEVDHEKKTLEIHGGGPIHGDSDSQASASEVSGGDENSDPNCPGPADHRRLPQGSCLEVLDTTRGTHCGAADSITVKIRNRCDTRVYVRMCLERPDNDPDCGAFGVKPGSTRSSWTCHGTGQMSMDAVFSPQGANDWRCSDW
jgi:hypothetical protein